jgi:hypothetical protein
MVVPNASHIESARDDLVAGALRSGYEAPCSRDGRMLPVGTAMQVWA